MPDSSDSPEAKIPQISRRDFLKKTGNTAMMVIGAEVGRRFINAPFFSDDKDQQHRSELKQQSIKVEVGEPETIDLPGIQYYPDGHISYMKNTDGIKAWIAATRSGYMLTGTDIAHLVDVQEVIGPSTEGFDRDYAAPGSVISGQDGKLLMFYHGEYHPQEPNGFPFNAGIGLAISHDGGVTWKRQGQIIKGKNDRLATDRVYGAGQPSVIMKDDYFYLFFIDWNGKDADVIHLARATKKSNGLPGSWEKYHKGRFEKGDMDGKSTPVITPVEAGDYASMPGVSWNSNLQRFLAIFESGDGFYLTTSVDCIDWTKAVPLLKTKTSNSKGLQKGDIWNGYPTLWSPHRPNDQETDDNMLLVYSEGVWEESPHSMRIRKVKLSQVAKK